MHEMILIGGTPIEPHLQSFLSGLQHVFDLKSNGESQTSVHGNKRNRLHINYKTFNPFLTCGLVYPYHLDKTISILAVSGGCFRSAVLCIAISISKLCFN